MTFFEVTLDFIIQVADVTRREDPARRGAPNGPDTVQPFPSNPLASVNSPVEVTVNGKPAEVLGTVGYPGAVDAYQVNFRVPTDTAKGPASIQVTAAWISGAPVSIPVQ